MPTTPVERTLIELIRAAFPFNESAAPPPDPGKINWPSLVQTATRHGLAPLLFAALKHGALVNGVPSAALDGLRLAYVRASIGNQLAFQELAVWLDHFEREQIAVVLLKGAALAPTLYDDRALRPMGDLDLLIPRAAVARVQAALVEQGYRASTEMAQGFAERFSVERSFLRLGKRPAQIDLHWHAFTTSYYADRIPIEWFWQRTSAMQIEQRRALTFSPTAQLLYLATHGVLHQYRRLIWSYDLALLMARRAREIDWDEAFEAAAPFGLLPVLGQALAEVCEQWGISNPTAEACLGDRRTPWKDRLMFAALTMPADGETGLPSGLSAHGMRKKLAFGLRVLFPSPGYMRTRFQLRHRGWLPLCYLWRAGKGVRLMARAGLFITRAVIRSRRPRRAM